MTEAAPAPTPDPPFAFVMRLAKGFACGCGRSSEPCPGHAAACHAGAEAVYGRGLGMEAQAIKLCLGCAGNWRLDGRLTTAT